MCILSYVKLIAGPGSMHKTGCSGLVHWDDAEGWDGEGGGRWVQDREHMYTRGGFLFRSDQIKSVAQSCPTLCDPMNQIGRAHV